MRLLRPPVLALPLFALLAVAPLAAEDEWTKVSTENFELFTSGGEGAAKRTIRYFEQIRQFFLDTMSIRRQSDQPVRIIGFRNDKEFDPFRPNEFAAAYYTQDSGRDTIVLGDIGAERHETAVHEYMHLLVRSTGATFPPWLNEGFAELYSTLQPVGKKMQVGVLPMGRLNALQQLKWIPLERLLAVNHGDPEYSQKQHAGAFYSQSWLLVHMLNLDERYRGQVGEFLETLIRLGDGVKAFKKVYGLSPSEVEKALEGYSRQSSFMVLNLDIKLTKDLEEPTVEPASDLETRLILAGLLAGQREKLPLAAEQLRALAEQYPDSAETAEAQGYLAWRAGSGADAVPHFERAAELGGGNPKMYRDLAALSRGSRDLGFQIRMLEKSLELEPDHADSRRILGHLYINDKQWSRGIIELNKITQVKTNEEAFAMNMARAYAYYQVKDLDQSEKLVKMARGFSDDVNQRAQVERMLETIARTRDHKAAVEAAASLATAPPPPVDDFAELGGLDDFDRPELTRPDQPSEAHDVHVELRREQPSAAGRLTLFECLGAQAQLHLESAGETRTFALLDPMNIVIKRNGEPAPDVSFTCGPQPGQPVRVFYAEPEGGEGPENVLALDFLDALP